MSKKITLGLLLLTAVALVVVPDASALPSYGTTCENCHPNTNPTISISTNITSITVAPSQKFDVGIDWNGGNPTGLTIIIFPAVKDNGLFNPQPLEQDFTNTPTGTTVSTLTAPAAIGSYTIRVYAVRKAPMESATKDIIVTVEAAQPPPAVNGTISGTVTNASSGTGISGATVTAGGISTTTNTNGNYSISIDAGTYTVTATATGYTSQTASGVSVTSGSATTQDLALTPEVTSPPPPPPTGDITKVIFQVINNNTGKPIKEAKVTIDEVHKETNRDGIVKFNKVKPGNYNYIVTREHYETATGSISVTGETELKVTVKLVPVYEEDDHEKGSVHEEDESDD